MVSAAALLILLSPPPPIFQRPLICAEVRFIGRYAHILVNCGADSYIRFAERPSRVLARRATRQTRPGYAALGWLLAQPFRRISANPEYVGYVALNFVLLIGSSLLLRSLIGVESLLDPAAIVPAAVLLVNHITKAFFWTPDLQIAGLFASMLSIWLARALIAGNVKPTVTAALVAGISSGLACLFYGAFVLIPASLTVALWIFLPRERFGPRLSATATLWVATAIPLVAWRSYVVAATGSFYSHETEHYHQFTWIIEQWRTNTLDSALLHNIAAFAGTIPRSLAVPLAFLAAAFVLAIRRKPVSRDRMADPAIKACAAWLAAAMPFYALMGFYDPRLTATLIPGFVVATGALTRGAFESQPSGGIPEPITIAAAGYALIVIMLPGPYA